MFPKNDPYVRTRHKMVSLLSSNGVGDYRVLDAFNKVPRHLFVSEALRYSAYELRSLPIGFNQTISNPLTVAKMLEALELDETKEVLEIGTGSGYQTAILAEMVKSVTSQERIEPLYKRAMSLLLYDFYYKNIELNCNDNFSHYKSEFDSIVVAAGAEKVPVELFSLLKVGGKLVLPVGQGGNQSLIKYSKVSNEKIIEYHMGSAQFVPLVRS